MDDNHRKIILDNIESLMNFTVYEELLKACVDSKLISLTMKEIIESNTNNVLEKHERLFKKITKRGPEAYCKLREILKNLKRFKAAEILTIGVHHGAMYSISNNKIANNLTMERNNNASSQIDGCIQSHNNSNESELTLKIYDQIPLEEFFEVKKSKKWNLDPKLKIYPMCKRDRGVLFMVNIIDFANPKTERRNGAEIDGKKLLKLFDKMGFKIFYETNITRQQFKQLLGELLHSDYVKTTECFVMALMTHGSMINNTNDVVEFYDGETMNVFNIIEYFKSSVCPHLIKKPKIFIFPFCRGGESDFARPRLETDNIVDSSCESNFVSTYADILICYGSVPGFKTHRDPEKGNWYIQKFCEIFAKHAHDTHIEDLLKMIGDSTGKMRANDNRLQTASYTSWGFNGKLFFNPGYYDDVN